MITLIGLTVVIAMRVVGLIMVIALLTIPPAIANLYLKDMRTIMGVSAVLSMLFCTAGLVISYALNLPSGGYHLSSRLGVCVGRSAAASLCAPPSACGRNSHNRVK